MRLDQLAQQCTEDARILADEKKQQIAVDAQPAKAETDALLLRQALQNLLDNAIKYSPPGSTISVRVSREDANWVIAVADQGPGIEPAHRARITERFYRVDDARSHAGGFGLGLAITRAYLRVLGGELRHEPAPGTGSIFQLILPVVTSVPGSASPLSAATP